MSRPPLSLIALVLMLASSRLASGSPRLANGFYGILADETDRGRVPAPAKRQVVIAYDPKVIDPATKDPIRHLLLPARPDVPMSLVGAPKKEPSGRGNSQLLIQLDPKHTKKLEEFTRRFAMKRNVAVVVGGEVISTHKIREAITGGRIQITRCGDNACEVIYTKLKGDTK